MIVCHIFKKKKKLYKLKMLKNHMQMFKYFKIQPN